VNDHEKAARLREKGWKGPSASDAAKSKSRRSASKSTPASGSTEEALRNFDPSRPQETAVPRSEESVERARSHKFRIPRLPR
jgi:hypothetical protein